MISIISNIEEINREDWSDFVLNHPKGSVFQSPEMYESYESTEWHNPIIFIAKQENRIVGVLLAVIISGKGKLLSYFTSRSIIIGGPIVENDNQNTLSLLLKSYNERLKGSAIYTQIRNQFEQLTLNDAYQTTGFRFKSHLNYIIKLDNIENIWDRIGKGRVKQIKKSIKNKLFVDVYDNDIDEKYIKEGYEIIRSVYKRANLPLVDIELIKQINNRNLLVMFVVRDVNNNMLGCRFGLKFKDNIYGWYAGSYSEYYSLYPNDILIWETLKWSCESGYKTFDYGGAGEPNKPYGVRNFKSQMGGKLVNYGRYELVHNKLLMTLGLLGMYIIKVFKIKLK